MAFIALGGSQLIPQRVGVPGAYAGRLKVNILQLKRVDGSAYHIDDTQMRMIHGSMDYNDKVGTIGSYAVTGDMKTADGGLWYLCIDYGTNTTAWVDPAETLKDPYITRYFGADGDRDGINEDYLELNFAGLPALKAGEDKKEVEITIVSCPARRASITYTSLTNASSIGTSSYAYYTSTGYMTGFTEGDLAKLGMIEITFPNNSTQGDNSTYPDFAYQYWKLTHLKIGPYTFTPTHFGAYDLANARFQYTVGDLRNHHGGQPFYYAKNSGALWAQYELKAYCNYGAGSKNIFPTINFYFYQPSGVMTTAFARIVQFSS